ncbi:MAG: hypothetical protein AMXMBFR44_6160 [Candidatus Campbellbacteria bacterium]
MKSFGLVGLVGFNHDLPVVTRALFTRSSEGASNPWPHFKATVPTELGQSSLSYRPVNYMVGPGGFGTLDPS